jgi:hypothetical protein
MMGGALGLAVLASVAASRTESLSDSGEGTLAALNGGYHVAFMVGAIFAILAGVVAATLIKSEAVMAHGQMPEEAGAGALATEAE